MENFITGYTGHESEMRAAMLEVLGKEKYDFFFEKVSGRPLNVDMIISLGPLTVSRLLLHLIRRQVPRLPGPQLRPHPDQPPTLYG